MTPTPRPKVFGIGFHKTGTTSLAEALRLLGYRVTGPNFVGEPDIATTALTRAMALVPRFDAFQDNPWPLLYRELDAAVPGSRFVLTVRDPDRWLASVVGHFGTDETPMRRWIYGDAHGAPVGSEARYLERYREHRRAVDAHFAGRDDLLVMDLTAGDGWDVLCPFLGQAPPDVPFPRANTAASRSGSVDGAGVQGRLLARSRRLRRGAR